jgi:hypothetical protein
MVLKLGQALPVLSFLAFLQVADIITTNLIPDLEVNPVTLFLFGHLGALWWLPKVGICLAIAWGALAARGVPRRTLAMVTAAYTIVVVINLVNVANIYLV